MFTVALAGEKTKPRRGHGLPAAPGRQCGAVQTWRGRGMRGAWAQPWGKAWRLCSGSVANGGTWQLRGALSPGWSLPKERAWLRAGSGFWWRSCHCLAVEVGQVSVHLRASVSPSLQGQG